MISAKMIFLWGVVEGIMNIMEMNNFELSQEAALESTKQRRRSRRPSFQGKNTFPLICQTMYRHQNSCDKELTCSIPQKDPR